MNTKTKTCQNNSSNCWSLSNPARTRSLVTFTLALVGVIGSLGMANTAQAVTVYQTGFETPIFHDGDQLVGKDGWTGAVPAPPFSLNPEFAVITDALAKKGRQSVEVRGVDLVSSGGNTTPYDAVGSYRRPLNHTISGNNKLVRVDADMLLETYQQKTSDDFFGFAITLRDGDGVALGEVGLFSNRLVQAYPITRRVGEVTPPVFTRPIRFNKWHHITMLLDTANDTTAYFIDEQFIGAIQAPSTSNILARGAMVVYALPDGGGNARANYAAHLDNFRVSVHSSAPDID